MADFTNAVMTELGKELELKTHTGQPIQLTKMVFSDSIFEKSELEKVTALNVRQEATITNIEILNSDILRVESRVSNETLNEGYYIRSVGLYAADPNNGEILIAVSLEISGNCYMDSFNGGISGAFMQMYVKVSDAEKISVVVNPSGTATLLDLERMREEAQTAHDALYTQMVGYTDKEVASLINGAPETLDTLKEIADAIEKNDTIVDALNTAIGTKANKAELDSHVKNTVIHITSQERTGWNDKLSELSDSVKENTTDIKALNTSISSKANKAELDAHVKNTVTHITAAERTGWNAAAQMIHIGSNTPANKDCLVWIDTAENSLKYRTAKSSSTWIKIKSFWN